MNFLLDLSILTLTLILSPPFFFTFFPFQTYNILSHILRGTCTTTWARAMTQYCKQKYHIVINIHIARNSSTSEFIDEYQLDDFLLMLILPNFEAYLWSKEQLMPTNYIGYNIPLFDTNIKSKFRAQNQWTMTNIPNLRSYCFIYLLNTLWSIYCNLYIFIIDFNLMSSSLRLCTCQRMREREY